MQVTVSIKDREGAGGSGGSGSGGLRRRHFLFLQGPIGLFFSKLAQRLSDDGHAVYRINLHAGDRLFWRLPGAVDFRSHADRWSQFLSDCLTRWQVTDLLLFGDCRPFHRIAIELANARDVSVHVFEEGYLRPHWVTLEQGGVNANSSLSRDPDDYRKAVASLPPWDGGIGVRNSFPRRAAEDVLYHTAMVLSRRWYPGYRTHRPLHPYAEYANAAGRFLRGPISRRRVARLARGLAARSQPYYLFPLQLNADVQIRHHFSSGRMETAIERVIASFARCAPRDALLVLTEHPLETGAVDLKRVARRCARAEAVPSRVLALEGGSPHELVRQCRGMIIVNSTTGMIGMDCGVPVVALGRPIYSLAGLTFQGDLDDFWNHGVPADPLLFDAFRRVIAARTQINGGFYGAGAIAMAVQGAAQRLEQHAPQVRAVQPASYPRGKEFGFPDDLRPIAQ
jgi:capsular polysaccharide export protein